MTDQQELVPSEELDQELPSDAPADVPKEDSDDLEGEELVPKTQFDEWRSIKDRELKTAEQEIDALRRELQAHQVGQSTAIQRLAVELEENPAELAGTFQTAVDQAELTQLRQLAASQARREQETEWWRDQFRAEGINPDISPEFAQAALKHDQDSYRTALLQAVRNKERKEAELEEKEERLKQAQAVRQQEESGQLAALDTASGAAPTTSSEEKRVREYKKKRDALLAEGAPRHEVHALRDEYGDILHLV